MWMKIDFIIICIKIKRNINKKKLIKSRNYTIYCVFIYVQLQYIVDF